MQQVVPNCVRVDTTSYALAVPTPIFNDPDPERVFTFLVTAWVFTAWLKKRFPKADVTDCALMAGLCASVSPPELIKMSKMMKRKFANHPKTQLDLDMMASIRKTFTSGKDLTIEEFAEVTAYNEAATREVDALFPCTCGECPTDKSN